MAHTSSVGNNAFILPVLTYNMGTHYCSVEISWRRSHYGNNLK